MTDQPDRVGILDQAGCRRDRAGNADADRPGLAGLRLRSLDEVADRRHRGTVVAARRGNAAPRPDRAVVGQRDGLNLGPAEVNSDTHAAAYVPTSNADTWSWISAHDATR